MDISSSSRFPITATSHGNFHRSMSNCALRSFKVDDNNDEDSNSSATSTTRGRRRFRRTRQTSSSQQQQQPTLQDNYYESPRTTHSNVEWISTGMYEVSIRIKEDSNRPPNTSIQSNEGQHSNTEAKSDHSCDDESSISSMSSYGDTTTTGVVNVGDDGILNLGNEAFSYSEERKDDER